MALATTCLWFNTQAQDYVDLVKLNFNTTSPSRFKNSTVTTRIREIDAEATLPLRINATTNFITGFIYENINCRLTTVDTDETFGSAALKLGINKIHSEKWSGTYMLLPKLASDFNGFTKKDFQFGAVALMKYVKNDRLSYKVGVYYNAELFGPWVVPLVGLYYKSANKKIEANLTLPLLADVNYTVNGKLAVGFNFSGQVRTYHLSAIANGNDGYVARSVNELFAYLKLPVTKNVILQFRGGRSMARHYRAYDIHDKVALGVPLAYFGDSRQQLNSDLKDGWVYQAILLYRFYTAK
jgi:hypothetical protein